MSLAILAGALLRIGLLSRFLQRPIIAAASVVVVTALTNGMFTYVLSRRKTVNYCAGTCFAAWILGQVLADRAWLTGICFYIPSIPACLGMALVGIKNFAQGYRRTGTLFLLGSLIPAATVLQFDNHILWTPDRSRTHNVSSPAGTALRDQHYKLVHWNAFDGRIHWTGAQAQLLDNEADIYVFSETPKRQQIANLAVACAAKRGEPYSAIRRGTISTVARGKITQLKTVFDTAEMEVHSFAWEVDGQTLRVLCVDLASSILVTRGPLLKKVNETIESYAPDLVVGDFNAPRRSLELRNMPAGYRHAYDECGEGLSYTWPVPLPCYSIDQCIVGPRVVAERYDLETLWSDHRAQSLTFRIGR